MRLPFPSPSFSFLCNPDIFGYLLSWVLSLSLSICSPHSLLSYSLTLPICFLVWPGSVWTLDDASSCTFPPCTFPRHVAYLGLMPGMVANAFHPKNSGGRGSWISVSSSQASPAYKLSSRTSRAEKSCLEKNQTNNRYHETSSTLP